MARRYGVRTAVGRAVRSSQQEVDGQQGRVERFERRLRCSGAQLPRHARPEDRQTGLEDLGLRLEPRGLGDQEIGWTRVREDAPLRQLYVVQVLYVQTHVLEEAGLYFFETLG